MTWHDRDEMMGRDVTRHDTRREDQEVAFQIETVLNSALKQDKMIEMPTLKTNLTNVMFKFQLLSIYIV